MSSGTAFVLSAVRSTLFGDRFSTWASSEQHSGSMPFNGPLRFYSGKLSGPRESVSPGVWVKYPVVSNVPTGCCTQWGRLGWGADQAGLMCSGLFI